MKKIFLILGFWIGTSVIMTGVIYHLKSAQNIPDTVSPLPTGTQQKKLTVVASIPYWDQEKAVESLRNNVDVIDEISLFWYNLQSDGSITPYQYTIEDETLIQYAKANNVKVTALIANLPEVGSWDSQRVNRVISSADARTKHIADILSLVNTYNFDGVNIDYENLNSYQTTNFTLFIQELSSELKKRDKTLSVPVFARQSKTDRSWGQDIAAISHTVNQETVMTYDEHYQESEAGPVASIEWVRESIAFSLDSGVPPQTLFLGIGLYGYEWSNNGRGRGVEYDEVQEILQREQVPSTFDEQTKSNVARYGNNVLWFEDAKSVEEKLKIARDYNLGGIALWRLGREDPAIWDMIREYK